MLVRPIADAERPAAAELFAVAFESPLDRSALPAPEWNRPQIWAAFSDAGEMMSTIYITDFAVQFDGTVCKTGGIGGVASLPQHRRSGGIRACFQQALPQMYRDGYVFSYLFPFSTAYYRKFGYESCVQRYRTVVHLPQLPPLKDAGTLRLASPAAPLLDEVRALDAQWEAYYNMSVQHTAADYDWLLRCDPAAKQEFTYVWFDASGTPKAYTTFRLALEPDGRKLVCSRFCFSSPEGYRGLMTLFSRLAADHQYVKFRIPAEPAIQYLMPEWSLGAVCWELEPAGMVRVINSAEALRRARYRGSGTITLRLHDAQIPENDGCFSVRFEHDRAVCVSRTDAQPDAELEISAFSALLCGVCRFDMAKRFFPALRVFCDDSRLEQVFFEKPLMITDYF